MRILLVGVNHRAEIRGANTAIHGFARALAAAGHDVTFLQAAAPQHRVEIPGVRMAYTGQVHKSRYPLYFGLRRLQGFHVVHANDQSAGVLALRSRVQSVPLVAELHPPRIHAEPVRKLGWRWRYIRAAIRHGPRLAVPSRWLADGLVRAFGVSPDRLHVLEHGVGEHWFQAAELAPSQPPRVALVNMKGVEVALRAFAAVGPRYGATLELYGVHRNEERYRRLASELGIQRYTSFRGFVVNENLPQHLSTTWLLLHPAESESFGQVLAEAAAVGVPAVTSRVGAIPELVADGESGVLCPPRDVEAFAEALERLLADREERDRMAQAARERARERWRWSAVVARAERELYGDGAGSIAAPAGSVGEPPPRGRNGPGWGRSWP